ncbi:hypothetical protein LguiA_028705 [Lonicera macranthoides]
MRVRICLQKLVASMKKLLFDKDEAVITECSCKEYNGCFHIDVEWTSMICYCHFNPIFLPNQGINLILLEMLSLWGNTKPPMKKKMKMRTTLAPLGDTIGDSGGVGGGGGRRCEIIEINNRRDKEGKSPRIISFACSVLPSLTHNRPRISHSTNLPSPPS